MLVLPYPGSSSLDLFQIVNVLLVGSPSLNEILNNEVLQALYKVAVSLPLMYPHTAVVFFCQLSTLLTDFHVFCDNNANIFFMGTVGTSVLPNWYVVWLFPCLMCRHLHLKC